MNKKIAIAAGLVLFLATAAFFYFVGTQQPVSNSKTIAPKTNNSFSKEEKTAAERNGPEQTIYPYVGEDFSIVSPDGWIQAQLPSTLVSFLNSRETHPDGSAAAKVNFKSYMAITFDNTNGQSLEEIAESVKQQVSGVVPGVKFSETIGNINGQPAKFFEADFDQQNIAFKVMIVIVAKGDKYFTIFANTTAEKWPQYRQSFYDSAASFKFKY